MSSIRSFSSQIRKLTASPTLIKRPTKVIRSTIVKDVNKTSFYKIKKSFSY